MIKPFGRNILVIPVKKEQILVSDSDPINTYGEVVAVGNEVKEIKVSDVIGFTKWGVRELEIDGTKHFFVPEDSEFILGNICKE